MKNHPEESMDITTRVVTYDYKDRIYDKDIKPIVEEKGNETVFTFKKEDFASKGYFNHHLLKVKIEFSNLRIPAGTPGYMVYQTEFGCGYVRTFFKERKDCEYVSWVGVMPVFGICGNENAVMCRLDGMAADTRLHIEVRENVYHISPEIILDCDDPYEDISIHFYSMPNAGYVEMAKAYREYQMKNSGCVPLKERVKNRPVLARSADAMEIRIRMGWKPLPTPVRHQTLENEPEMKVACNVEELNRIVDKLQEKGVERAEICLVGWAVGGHDGRFPQQYPCDPRFGGDEQLIKFIKRAKSLGYMVVCHTVSCGAYEIANNWNPDYITKEKSTDGTLSLYVRELYSQGGLNGGEPYELCPQCAYEKYAVKDLPKVREYGFEGMHYVDELTAHVPKKCKDPAHPCNRRQIREYFRKIAALSQELFGGYQSEGAMDFMASNVDAILYTQSISRVGPWNIPLFDDDVPFWQIVYHGIIMSNSTSGTVNWPIKEGFQHLKFLEYGGRPLMYFNSKFGEERDWMGKVDLYNKTPEDLETAGEAIKKAYDEYEKYKYLQYEFIENHERLSKKVARTTYSDGTVVTVNYEDDTYRIEKNGREI